MLNVRVKKALLTILTACLTVLMTIGAILGFVPTPQTVKAADGESFVKVTEAPADWSGTYLIVYEDGNAAFNGALTTLDAANNNIAVTITDGKIEATDKMKAATFTIAKSGSNYTIQSASDKYIGQSSNTNGLKTDKAYANTISLNSDKSVNLVSGGAYLRFNAASDQNRFRYYKSASYTGQKAICLYKLTEASSGDTTCKVDCYTESWGAWNTENGQHSRTDECDFCGAEMTESGACEVSNGTYESVSDTQHKLIGTCDTCGNPTEISAACVYNVTNDDDNGVTYKCDDCPNTYTNPKYTITFHVPAGIDSVEELRVEKGATEVLPEADTDADGKYTFAGWTSEASWNNTTSPAIYTKYVMGEANVDLYALYTYTEAGEATGYVKVTNASQLAAGDTVVIVASDYDYALSTNQKSNNRSQAAVTKDGDTVTFGDDVQLITLEEGTVAGTFAFNVGNGYLYAAGANSHNYLKTKSELDENGSWNIEINDGVATIKAQNGNERNWLRYNATNNTGAIFSCYVSGQTDICLYRLASGTTYYVTELDFDSTGSESEMKAKIVFANLTLGEELVMNYKVEMDVSYASAAMTFTMNGESVTVSANDELVDGLYVYSFAIAPQYMGANISAVLTLNGETLASKAKYSVKDYVEYQLANSTSTEMTQLLNDLLHYGAAAQLYNEYDVNNLVNANIDANENAPTSTNFTLETKVEDPDIYFTAAGLKFSSNNTLYIKLNGSLTGNIKLFVNGAEATLNGNVYYTEGLKATQFDDEFVFELRDGETVIQTLTYSVNAYAYAMLNSTNANMVTLAKALYNYGVSADAFVALGN